MDDVLIVGGSFAGLSAALALGRSRRKVTVLDTGLNRNRYAAHAHNLFGQDGVPPGEILQTARRQLQAYPTVRFVDARAEVVSGKPDDFTVATSKGEFAARRLVLSYGVTDQFPPIAGFEECWGKTVIHCPFCHGYEVADGRWGLIYTSAMSLHATSLYENWTDRQTLFTDGHHVPDAERHKLDKRGVRVVDGKVVAIEHENGNIAAVRTDDGSRVALDALFAHPQVKPSARLHEALGLDMDDTPFGQMVKVDGQQQTSRDGVFAAGDLASAMHSLSLAIRDGMMAGVGALRSMMN